MSIFNGQPQTVNYLSFDGSNDYVDINNDNISFNGDFEINITFIPIKTDGYIFGFGYDNNNSFVISYDLTEVQIIFKDTSVTTYKDTFNWNLNQEYDLKVTRVGSTYSYFVDNTLELSFTENIVTFNDNSIQIGHAFPRNRTQGYFGGEISYLDIIDNGTTVAQYNFDEGLGTTLNDSVGNNDGTIVGATWDSKQVLPEIQNIYKGTTEISKVFKGNTLVFQSFAPIQATGGSISDVNINGVNYRIHSFTSTGTSTFNVSNLGNSDGTVDTLIVAGGGGGGGVYAGGGGAGGLIFNTNVNVNNTNHTITVGNGGGGANNDGSSTVAGLNGQNSTAFNFTSIGGGGGGSFDELTGKDGGSGGGGGGKNDFNGFTAEGLGLQPTSLNAGFGNNGGKGAANTINDRQAGGGGGGALQNGEDGVGTSNPLAGNGGNGLDYSSIFTNNFGENGYFAGGGGGGVRLAGTPGSGGIGGGGNGNISSGDGFNGLINTGGGGGAGGQNGDGGNGGSGIVLIRYRLDPPS